MEKEKGDGEMSDDWENITETLACVAAVGMVIAVIIGMSLLIMSTLPAEQETVVGEVIDVETYDDYMELFMKDGTSYKIRYPGDNIDLTVNSNIVMRLSKKGVLWFEDDIWDYVSITKVPGD